MRLFTSGNYGDTLEWEDAGDVDLIILRGSGEKAFCAGGDVLAVIRSAKEAAEGGTCTVHKDFFRFSRWNIDSHSVLSKIMTSMKVAEQFSSTKTGVRSGSLRV
ncbi:hypothetical protein TELCIR_07586 [Teladorsagia circumcincta]|uniref:3-hydroxyisobutyryl-CoA hydrolase n=1 Tax=Teladorsagia circumcincta TaxID=45464 RepID=A0A2G9UJY7_TELCI|nr:hypothetical protein TELCIR_07586 [Teladorsagia circumcincta]